MSYCTTCGTPSERDPCAKCYDIHLSEMGLREMWKRLDWKDFQSTDDTLALKKCQKWAASWPHSRGLILTSKKTGNGKSLLAACILKEVGVGTWVNCVDMLNSIKDSFGRRSEPALYRRALTTRLLVLDDMGSHSNTEWSKEQLYVLVNTRVENLLPIIATTNLSSGQEVEDFYGTRTADRLLGSCDVIKFKGDSWRRR